MDGAELRIFFFLLACFARTLDDKAREFWRRGDATITTVPCGGTFIRIPIIFEDLAVTLRWDDFLMGKRGRAASLKNNAPFYPVVLKKIVLFFPSRT